MLSSNQYFNADIFDKFLYLLILEADFENLTRYMFGPDQFCQGLSPGGGDSCIDIPDGCFIAVPLDNTVPQINCTL